MIMRNTEETVEKTEGRTTAGVEVAEIGPQAILIKGLTKSYGDFVAVDKIDLEVKAGQLFGFLGPNGAGKSTTIGCLTGLLDPTAGSIRLLGQEFTPDGVELKRRIGVMPEGGALFEQLYAEEFLTFQARMYGLEMQVVRQRVEQLLESLDLPLTRKRIGAFSTGMKKKTAFAAAIIHSPEILFLDEPFESIDPAGVSMMKRWLREFVAQGKTVLLTSHVLETVEKLCDHVAVMVSGRIAWRGELVASAAGKIRLTHNGCSYSGLEELFLELSGEKSQGLNWL